MLVENWQYEPTPSPWVPGRCLHDPTFSHFGTVSACDGRTYDDSL